MSVSKLECLPNELFLEIFEKNLNGVDILILISCLKKERFHQLIQQIQHWYFDFRYCPKDSFYYCLHFPLVNFVEKIEELFLSDENAPDQIQHFLSYFGSFAQFKRLRKLYFHVNFHAVNWPITHSAICSLSETPIETISFGVTNAEKDTTLGYIVKDIIGLKTIKRFSFTSDAQHSFSFPITNHSSTLEYLTYYDEACDLEKTTLYISMLFAIEISQYPNNV